jgi:hypothetical protein
MRSRPSSRVQCRTARAHRGVESQPVRGLLTSTSADALVTIEQTASEPLRYRCVMKRLPLAAFAIAGCLLLAPVRAQQATPAEPHDHSATVPQAGGMMNHDKMMADMKAADARLDALAQKMKSALGDDKILAMQQLLAELLQNQVTMHEHMLMMHTMMMSQMAHKEVSK